MRLDRASQQYVKVGVSRDGADPGTGLTVSIAVVASGKRPTEPDFKTATWADSTFKSGASIFRHAMILVAASADAATGAQDVALAPTSFPSRFDVYVDIVDVPEVVVERVGSIVIY